MSTTSTMFKRGQSVKLRERIKCNNMGKVLNAGETGIVKSIIENQYTVIAVKFSVSPDVQYVVPGLLESV